MTAIEPLLAPYDRRDRHFLLRHREDAGARAAERAEAEALRPKRAAGQVRAGRAQRTAERKAQAAREASRSVRDIYRRLASALHPDREIERDLKMLDDPRLRRAFIDGLPGPQDADMPDLEELAALAALFGGTPPPRRPGASASAGAEEARAGGVGRGM